MYLAEQFDEARKLYPNPSNKRSNEREFANFVYRSKHPLPGQIPFNIKEVLPLLRPAIESQIRWREQAKGEFRPAWKVFSVWINNGCWEVMHVAEQKKDPTCANCGGKWVGQKGRTYHCADPECKRILFGAK